MKFKTCIPNSCLGLVPSGGITGICYHEADVTSSSLHLMFRYWLNIYIVQSSYQMVNAFTLRSQPVDNHHDHGDYVFQTKINKHHKTAIILKKNNIYAQNFVMNNWLLLNNCLKVPLGFPWWKNTTLTFLYLKSIIASPVMSSPIE